MKKRYEPMKEFGRSTKKPKLDITINKGKPMPPQCSTNNNNQAGGQREGQKYSKPSSPVKSSPNNFWDDEDDDVILLATQVAEIQAAASRMPVSESEITFSEFAPYAFVHAATSTQRLTKPPTGNIPDQAALSDLFNDDDDEAFAMLVCEDAAPKCKKQEQQRAAPKEDIFKLPAASTNDTDPVQRGEAPMEVLRIDPFSAPNTDMPSSQSAARRQLASERQIKFLMERVDALKKENSKLTKDLAESKTKMESKEGETSLLRDELRHMKQQIQNLKMEKIFSTEAARTECKTKIAELSKQVEAKQTELQLKSVEYSVLKMRHADETKRLEITMRSQHPQNTIPPNLAPAKKQLGLLKCLRGLTLNNASIGPTKDDNPVTEPIPPAIFEYAPERGTSKTQRTLFQLELEKLQTILAQLHLMETQALTTIKREDFCSEIISSICKVFPEFWTYVHSLEFLKNCRIHPYHAYDLLSDHSDYQRKSIHQVQELHAEERAISLRRYVAGLSVICRLLPMLTTLLLRHQHGEYMLLQIGIDAINKIGFSHEICEHFGLLEAFAMLLHSMLQTVECADVDDRSVALLVALLKGLIFCRPNPWVFRRIAECVLQCKRLPQTLSLLCVNSDPRTFTTDQVRSVYRFSMDSCLLQVYSGLLEIAFPLYKPLRRKHFNLLVAICEQHVRFISHCVDDPPKFIHDNLPNYEDDEEDENDSNEQQSMDVDNPDAVGEDGTNSIPGVPATSGSIVSSSSATIQNPTETLKCECYSKLCLSLVTLLFQLLRQWALTEKKLENFKIEQISKISVKLLHTTFCDNYITRLFREAEETTKHYLYLICKWWSESTELLHFNEIDIAFLHKLQGSHVMPKQLCEEQSSSNVDIDLAEWHRTTNDNGNKNVNIASTSNAPGSIATDLRLIEDAIDEEKFFEGLKGYAFNFE